MPSLTLICFDCDEPLCAEALEWHPVRCAACALAEYEREEHEAAQAEADRAEKADGKHHASLHAYG